MSEVLPRAPQAPVRVDETTWADIAAVAATLRGRLRELDYGLSSRFPLPGTRGDLPNDLVTLGRALRGRHNALQPSAAPDIVAALIAPRQPAVRALHRLLVRGEELPSAAVHELLGAALVDQMLANGLLSTTSTGLRAEIVAAPYGEQLFIADAFRWRDHADYSYLGRSSFTAADFLAAHPIGAPRPGRRLLDLGCGVGVGALTCAPWYDELLGTDVIERCLWFARINARLTDPADRVAATFRRSDVFDDVDGTFDLVVANTPCVWTDGENATRTYESGGGAFGLELPVRMITGALDRLRPAGAVIAVIMAPYLHGEPQVAATLEDLCAGRPARVRVHPLFDVAETDELARERRHGVTRMVRYLVVLEPASSFSVQFLPFDRAHVVASRLRATAVRRSRRG